MKTKGAKTAKKEETNVAKNNRSGVALILSGGSGSRMKGVVKDKVLEELMGLPVILHSFKAFVESGEVCDIIFVCKDATQQVAIERGIKKHFSAKALKDVRVSFAKGGKERQDSVWNGLKKISSPKEKIVFIHDGARPMVGAENIKKLSIAAKKSGASVLASRVTDTIKRTAKNLKNLDKCALSDLERNRLWAMQTPQVFCAHSIISAHSFIRKNSLKVTDDVAVYAAKGGKVAIVENLSPNPKITVPEDIVYVEFLAKRGFFGDSIKK